MKKILICFILFIGFAQANDAKARYDEIKKQEKEAKARALERERKLKKQNEINRLNKARDDELVLIDYNSKKSKVLLEHLVIDEQLKSDYYSLIGKKDNERSFLDRWHDRERKINENMSELNNKISAIDIECKKRLKANQIKYDTEEQKNYIDY